VVLARLQVDHDRKVVVEKAAVLIVGGNCKDIGARRFCGRHVDHGVVGLKARL
jgi:predicted nucleotidyltransferase